MKAIHSSLALNLALLSSAIPTPESSLTTRQLLGGTTTCGPVAVLFCRGTFEPGSYGATVGSAFTTALQAVLPFGTQFYGVDYSADVVGYMTGGGLGGISDMRKKAEAYVTKCPGIKLVLGGYSQGAQVTHKALSGASQAVKQATRAVVLFGDPLEGVTISGISKDKILTICATGDTICWGLPIITASHMVYTANVGQATTFVSSKVRG